MCKPAILDYASATSVPFRDNCYGYVTDVFFRDAWYASVTGGPCISLHCIALHCFGCSFMCLSFFAFISCVDVFHLFDLLLYSFMLELFRCVLS